MLTLTIPSGLLAVHLLGTEFNRTVCIIPRSNFLKAFEPRDAAVRKQCDDYFQIHKKRPAGPTHIILVNFRKGPDECLLQKQLASNEKQIYIQANTYCRWRTVPPNFFFQFYRAKREFLDTLPYEANNPPKTVVHLRLQDGAMDVRKGLDEKSLAKLGQLLSKKEDKPYLVTNLCDGLISLKKNMDGSIQIGKRWSTRRSE